MTTYTLILWVVGVYGLSIERIDMPFDTEAACVYAAEQIVESKPPLIASRIDYNCLASGGE